MALPENENEDEQEGPVIRDKRRIDPETGELRTPEEEQEAAPEAAEAEAEAAEAEADVIDIDGADGGELAAVQEQLAERIADLKRLQAEYANYRKRVDRDRSAVREQALAQVVGDLLPILDDIGRAREHDELQGGFKSVGESLEALVTKLGLKKYADKGDEFDPNVHEALTMVPSEDTDVPTVIEVFQPGYLIGERVLRPARVIVAGPGDDEPAASDTAEGTTDAADTADGDEQK